MSNRSPLMRGSSSSGWKSPRSTISTASPRRSPSGRRTPPGIRARPSPPPRNASTFCGCSTRASDRPSARPAGPAFARTRWTKSPPALLELPQGSRWYALFPTRRARPTQALRDHLFELRKKGFNRLFQGGRLFEFSTPESLLDIDFAKPLFVLVDRIAIGPDLHQRLVDTIEICYREVGRSDFRKCGRRPAAPLQREVPVQDLPDGVRESRSRSCSASIRPPAPARAARVSATRSTTTWTA